MPRPSAHNFRIAALAFAVLITFGGHAPADCPNLYDSQFGAAGTGNGQFSSPQRMATDVGGDVYVCDAGRYELHRSRQRRVLVPALRGRRARQRE